MAKITTEMATTRGGHRSQRLQAFPATYQGYDGGWQYFLKNKLILHVPVNNL
jgi:hypothetical protein